MCGPKTQQAYRVGQKEAGTVGIVVGCARVGLGASGWVWVGRDEGVAREGVVMGSGEGVVREGVVRAGVLMGSGEGFSVGIGPPKDRWGACAYCAYCALCG